MFCKKNFPLRFSPTHPMHSVSPQHPTHSVSPHPPYPLGFHPIHSTHPFSPTSILPTQFSPNPLVKMNFTAHVLYLPDGQGHPPIKGRGSFSWGVCEQFCTHAIPSVFPASPFPSRTLEERRNWIEYILLKYLLSPLALNKSN